MLVGSDFSYNRLGSRTPRPASRFGPFASAHAQIVERPIRKLVMAVVSHRGCVLPCLLQVTQPFEEAVVQVSHIAWNGYPQCRRSPAFRDISYPLAIMVDRHKDCDLCGLNRATLHLDEILEGTMQVTAHLCPDCWYRLGIRVPLGNIWHHIERAKRDLHLPAEQDPIDEIEEILEGAEDIDELLDPGSLAVAEPDEEPADLDKDIEDSLLSEDDRTDRSENLKGFEEIFQDPQEEESPEDSGSLGIPAMKIDRIHPSLICLLPHDMLVRSKAIPVKLEGSHLTVALADPFDKIAVANVAVYVEKLGFTFLQAFADEEEILTELRRHKGPPDQFESLS